jgi:PBP1b-binding outer membrane lipoprotein LpoB
MKRFVLPLLLILTLVLAACSPSQGGADQNTSQSESVTTSVPTPTDDPALLPTLFPNMTDSDDLARIDEQGAVIVQASPLNLGTPAETLEFDIAMNTHSVDLSTDLAELSTLATDTGLTVQASKWDATPGGHHVDGKLIFPSMQDGKSILEGASKLTLTIINVDAASRIFEWELK